MKKLIRITTVPLSLDKLLGEQLTYINQFFEVTAISADKKELERIATKYSVKNHHVEMTRTISPLKDIISVWKLYQYLRKEKPSIVHSHTPKAGIVGMMAAWLAGVPHRFHTVAGLPLLESAGSRRTILNNIEKLTCRLATKVYPNSFELQKIIVQAHFCNPEKMKVIGNGSSNGIDTQHFSPIQISIEQRQQLREHIGLSGSDFVFIFVGRLVKDKGINELITAFKNLQSFIATKNDEATPNTKHPASNIQHPTSDIPHSVIARKNDEGTPNIQHHTSNIPHPTPHAQHPTPNTHHPTPRTPKLLLVGPLEQHLDPLCSETLHEIENNPDIISIGFQEEVRPYFAISDALVFPSYREGFPNVVLQSLAMQLPAIVTNINGCNEIITQAQNGLIVPPKDHISLQHSMEQLLTDLSLYQHLKNSSRDSIAPYEQSLIWSALLAEYQSVVEH